ncbi:RNA methyltransferase [Cellulomonas sp. JZ18]|uniref:TrmH family RNA methyltransferase n=1 Tax=Cellulomonas sp. JZ18 TaxID=2654191 RepID=UPI0012D42814|nr:RNA methyltransferase [Cellulomonas sp. JZ18]QGQ21013.1 RNA methyltransferase [Cellulomonas sp. JZ18]
MTNPRADRVKHVRSLAQRSVRRRTGTFLVEGPQSVREAVAEVPDQVREVYVGPDAADRYADVVAAAAAAGVRVRRGSTEVLDAMSPDAQQLVAVVDAALPGRAEVLAHAPRLVAVLSQVRDPGNAGTVVRTADAAGADGVLLTGASVDVHNPKVVRSTAGSLFHLPVATGGELADVVADLRAAGLCVLAADGRGEHDLDALLDVAGAAPAGVPDLAAPTAWVFGNEAWGMSDDDRALADAVVRVPIRGRAESLNLATAAAVCLFASARAQRR